jgi:tetratricopeptide (TPR) repeat protein
MVTARNFQELLARAFVYQQKAMKLEPYAAYIHNEMGNLYMLSKKYALADQHFNTARELAPTWAIPWSNKIRVGLATGNLKSALEAVQMADSLQHNLSYSYVNAGMVMEKHGDLLAAESYFLKGIQTNGRHFLPYERLGNIYIRTGDYEKADSFLTKATILKNGQFINMDNYVAGMAASEGPPQPPTKWIMCDMFRAVRAPASKPYMRLVNAFLLIDEKPDSAVQIMKNLALRPGDMPLLHHYLGKTLYSQQKWREAEPILLQAISSYKSDSALSAFIQQHLPAESEADTCLLVRLMDHQYNVLQDHYLLARTYEHLGQPDKALQRYEIIMTVENNNQKDQAAYRGIYARGKNPMFMGIRDYSKYGQDAIYDRYRKPRAMGGYIKIANIYEKSLNYLAAENVYLLQVQLNLEAGNTRATLGKAGPYKVSDNADVQYRIAARRLSEAATFAFYQRMLRLFPRDTEWQEKAGLFLYNRLSLVFRNVPAVQYELAYEILNKYAFPFNTFYEDGLAEWEQQIAITLPGTGETLTIRTPKYDPVSTSLDALRLAVRLSGDMEPKTNLLKAIADLNSWMGNREVAFEAYKELVRIQEPDSALRTRIINYCFAIHEPAFALGQLEALYKRGETTQAQNMQLADCYALSGSQDQAITILKNIKPADTAQQTQLSVLFAKASSLADRKAGTIDYLNSLPKPDTTHISQDSARVLIARRYYAVARLRAWQKQNNDAITVLNDALKNGFTSHYVLASDPAWNRLRRSRKWKALMSQYPVQPPEPTDGMGRTVVWYGTWEDMISN